MDFGISILSAGALAGNGNLEMVSSPDALLRAALAAKKHGFGVQMLPLSTLGLRSVAAFGNLLDEFVRNDIRVVSFEDRWGGDNWLHPWQKDLPDRKYKEVVAYYLLFPWRYRGVDRRIDLLFGRFPAAIPVDLPGGVPEIDRHKGGATYWIEYLSSVEARRWGVVLDTFHLLEFSPEEQRAILQQMEDTKVPVELLHVQFRDRHELGLYCQDTIRSETRQLLKRLVTMGAVGASTKVIFELDPSLVNEAILVKLRHKTKLLLQNVW